MKSSSRKVRASEEVPFWFNPYNELYGKVFNDGNEGGKNDNFFETEEVLVLIVGAYLRKTPKEDIDFSMSELQQLISSLNHKCIDSMVQIINKNNNTTYIGKGKADELKEIAESKSVSYIVCNHELTPVQFRNLYNLINIPIVDRTMIVMELFRRQAKTQEAKLQVQMIEYKYMLPRISSVLISKGDGARQHGGFITKGKGETVYELTQRKIKDKMKIIERNIEKLKKSKDIQKKLRENEFKVVLVGYTNAGKTTIMNSLTQNEFGVSNKVFQTLDTVYRKMPYIHYDEKNSKQILVADTVGFMSDLPSTWLEGFTSTIDEIKNANLLLHVIDISNKYYEKHIRKVDTILNEVGIGGKHKLYVFNKIDEIQNKSEMYHLVEDYNDKIFMSATNKNDVNKLRDKIIKISNTIELR